MRAALAIADIISLFELSMTKQVARDKTTKVGNMVSTHGILSSARRHGLNEFDYLCDILDRLVDLPKTSELREMLPDRWQPTESRALEPVLAER